MLIVYFTKGLSMVSVENHCCKTKNTSLCKSFYITQPKILGKLVLFKQNTINKSILKTVVVNQKRVVFTMHKLF